MKSVFLSISLVYLLGSPAGAQETRPSSTVCLGRWSPEFPIQRADGRPVYIERGLIAPFERRTLALGNPTFYWLERDRIAPTQGIADTAAAVWSFTRAGALIDSGGTADGVPMVDTHHTRRTPRLVGHDGRNLVVAWATADSAGRSPGDYDNRVELSSFDGERWSAPTTILTAPHLDLPPPPAVRPNGRNTPGAIAGVGRDSAGSFVRIAQVHGQTWTTSDWRGDVFTIASTAVTTWADGSMTLLVMGSLFSRGPGVYSIRAEPSATGFTWAAAQRLDSLRGTYQAFSSARLGADSMLVAWSGASVVGGANVLITALSIDRGATWTLTPPLAPRSDIDGVHLAVDGNGGLHALYRGAPEDQANILNSPGPVMSTQWRLGRWTAPTAISREASLTSLEVGVAGSGGLMTIWATGEVTAAGVSPRSVGSIWKSDCDGSR